MEELISELQREIFSQQGIVGDWGLHCLGRINTEHRGDADFMAAFYAFVMRYGFAKAAVLHCMPPTSWLPAAPRVMRQWRRSRRAFLHATNNMVASSTSGLGQL